MLLPVFLLACAPDSPAPTHPEGIDPVWLAAVEETLDAGSYAFNVGEGRAAASNTAQSMRLDAGSDGMRVSGAWGGAAFSLTAWGAPGNLRDVTARQWRAGECDDTGRIDPTGACIQRLEADHDGLIEYWRNTPGAVEQGFVVAEPVEAGELWLEVGVPGATVRVEGGNATFLLPDAQVPVGWDDLWVTDATGRELPASLEAMDEGVRVRVDTAEAVFPVTVDPIVTPYWFAKGASGSYSGVALASLGDIDGDNRADLAVGAYGVSSYAGAVYVYLGDQYGPSTTASWSYTGTQASMYLGTAVAAAGDVNGDGNPDLLVGAYKYDNGSTDEGLAYVFFGNGTTFPTTPDWTVEGNQTGVYFGYAVAGAGDTNHDGYDDVLVGAYLYDNGHTDEGRATLYFGSATGPSTTADWTGEANQTSAAYGWEVARAGDVNNDGYDDIAVGAYLYDDGSTDEGEVFVYHGSASGPATTASWSYDADQATAYLGYRIAGGGDVNEDGYDDLALSAYYYDNGSTNEGKVWVFHGSSSGLGTSSAWSVEGNSSSAYMGIALAMVPDADDDGDDELAIIKGSSSSTTVYVYNGSTSGLGASASYSGSTIGPTSAYTTVAGTGDVNGDGYGDLLLGSSTYSTSYGMTTLLFGGSGGIGIDTPWTVSTSTSYTIRDLAFVGDLSADGYPDVVLAASSGSYNYLYVYKSAAGSLSTTSTSSLNGTTSSYYGYNVADAGDVNNDGYDDLLVTQSGNTVTASTEGSVYVYYGSSSGVSSSSYARLDGGQAAAAFGVDATGAGDVNGDGYDDIAVAASGYDDGESNEGEVFVFHGSSSGIVPGANWSFDADYTNANLGAVTPAGDVNGDGYADLMFAAKGYGTGAYTSDGKAWVVLGSSAGLASSAAWSTTGGQTNAACAGLGRNGDVNGDGYDDVFFSCYAYDTTVTDAGRVQVFHGSSTGLSTTADWTGTGTVASDYYGYSATIAPDLDEDGDDDLAVGATGYESMYSGEGGLFVYLGDSAGLPTDADVTFIGLSASAALGTKLDGGDHDRDGRAELIVSTGTYAIYTLDFDDDDGDGVVEFIDCDDGDADRTPGGQELCDGLDNDCDGEIDESIPTWYLDTDGDGYGNSAYSTTTCTQPSGYVDNDDDCNDGNAALSPAATEVCDSVDNDCDGETDELGATGGSLFYADDDGDTYGDADSTLTACAVLAGYVTNDDDCDDTRATVSPGASEYCNSRDDDCDGATDENSALDATTWYRDSDGDGYGSTSSTSTACTQPAGYAASSTDCDDGSASVKPGGTETCNSRDDDCDGSTDEGVTTTYYADTDGDGFGSATATSAACSAPVGYVSNANDCDDGSATANPLGTETCNSVDDDCDGTVDDGVSTTYYRDADSDGYGDLTSTTSACSLPAGYASNHTDCDDADSAVSPAASETCNDVDDDCDGTADDGVATTMWYSDDDDDGFGGSRSSKAKCNQPSGYVANNDDCDDTDPRVLDGLTWYADADGDDYGDAATTAYTCTPASGYVGDDSDCDDTDDTVHPGARETWYDGTDADCDGASDYDQDEDGEDDPAGGGDDCDDTDDAVHPGASDAWYDGVDSDCAGNSDYDMDADGHDSMSHSGDDCDDGNAARYPGAPDTPYDGKVNDCDGTFEYDADHDGHDADNYSGDDCDDANSDVYPGAEEVWYDGVDEDCDGADDFDQDEDGVTGDDDCDDTDPDVVEPCPEDTGDSGGGGGGDDTGAGGGGLGDCGCSSTDRAGALLGLLGALGLAARRRVRA